METLANTMNNFDFWYMMSDSNDVYKRESSNHSDIRIALKGLSDSELIELASNLNAKAIEFFKIEVPSTPAPTETTEPTESKEVSTPSTKSVIFSNAWTMFKAELFETFGEALKASWKRSKLLTALKTGVAYFEYVTSKDEVRKAIGTLRDGNFEYKAKTPKKESKIEVVKYFDIQKQAFRACRVDRLLTVAA